MRCLGTQAIILMTCLPCKTVAPLSSVEQISVCLPSRIRMSRIVSISSTAKKAATQCSMTRKLESSSLGANANFSCRTFTCTIWGCNLMNHRSKQDVQLFLLSWDNQHAHDRKRGSMTKTTRKNVLLLQGSYLPKPTCDIDAVLWEAAVLVNDDELEGQYFSFFVDIDLSCPIALALFCTLPTDCAVGHLWQSLADDRHCSYNSVVLFMCALIGLFHKVPRWWCLTIENGASPLKTHKPNHNFNYREV